MAKEAHIAVVGSNEADMMVLANLLEDNLEHYRVDVATTAEGAIGLMRKEKSIVLVLAVEQQMGLTTTSLLKGFPEKYRPRSIALLTAGEQDQSADRMVNRDEPRYYELVQTIVQESEHWKVEQEEQRPSLSINAWIGLIAIALMILLCVYLLLI